MVKKKPKKNIPGARDVSCLRLCCCRPRTPPHPLDDLRYPLLAVLSFRWPMLACIYLCLPLFGSNWVLSSLWLQRGGDGGGVLVWLVYSTDKVSIE